MWGLHLQRPSTQNTPTSHPGRSEGPRSPGTAKGQLPELCLPVLSRLSGLFCFLVVLLSGGQGGSMPPILPLSLSINPKPQTLSLETQNPTHKPPLCGVPAWGVEQTPEFGTASPTSLEEICALQPGLYPHKNKS